ncbi:MAG: hypothetical protein ABSB70_20515 [Candidatus Velthaea sp.]|jgi:hypothetical protein
MNGNLFFEQLAPTASVAVLRVRDSDRSKRTLFDPAADARAGHHAEIDYSAPSLGGSHVAAAVSLGDSTNDTIRVVECPRKRVPLWAGSSLRT